MQKVFFLAELGRALGRAFPVDAMDTAVWQEVRVEEKEVEAVLLKVMLHSLRLGL